MLMGNRKRIDPPLIRDWVVIGDDRYMAELALNVTKLGVPTMRPMWWSFPTDPATVGLNEQYMLGDRLLVAPVTVQNATSREVYFPVGASWKPYFDEHAAPIAGGQTKVVDAPLAMIPVYERV